MIHPRTSLGYCPSEVTPVNLSSEQRFSWLGYPTPKHPNYFCRWFSLFFFFKLRLFQQVLHLSKLAFKFSSLFKDLEVNGFI